MASLIDRRYRSIKLLGHGGAGSVHLVEDTFHENRRLALKILELEADERSRELLAREFSHLTRLVHPNLVEVYDFGIEPGSIRPYFTMEPVEGADLLSATEGRGFAEIVPLLVQICRVLGYIHDLGYLHNDFKPANLLVLGSGEASQVKLLDFGLASLRRQAAAPSRAPTLRGTLHYVAPEILAGKPADERTDLYALGVVLYEVFTRRHPFETEGSERLGDALHSKPAAPSTLAAGLPAGLDELILRLLAPQGRDRPASAHAVLNQLNAIGGSSFRLDTPETTASYVHGGRFLERDSVLAVVDGLLQCIGAPGLAAAEPRPDGGAQAPEAAAGSVAPGLLLLVGDTGVGKTRLLEEIRIRGQLMGILPLEVHCSAGDVRYYGAVCQLLQRLTQTVADRLEVLDELMERYGAGVLKVFPELRPSRPAPPAMGLPAAQELERLHEHVSRFLLAIAAQRPSLILIDDLMRADERSLHLLHYLARSLWLRRQDGEGLPVAIVATLQQDGQKPLMRHPARAKLEQLRSEPFCWELIVEPLSSGATGALVASMFGLDAVGQRFADWVYALSEGNPLFVVELVEFLVDEGWIRRQDGRWQIQIEDLAGLEIPKSLADIMAGRLARLEPGLLNLLQALAAFGRPVPAGQLLELAGLEPAAAREAIDRLVHRQLAVERRRGERVYYQLEQPAKGEVIYHQMPEKERRVLHLRIARLLERRLSPSGLAEHAEELARHFVLGGDLLGACRHAWAAGDALRHVYSNKNALEMYQIVLDAFAACRPRLDWQHLPRFREGQGRFPLEVSEVVEVHWSSFQLHLELGQYREAMECAAALLYLAERTGDEALRAQATRRIGSVFRLQGAYERAMACMQRALEEFRRLEEVRGMAESLKELGAVQYLMGRHLQSLEYYQQSLGIWKSLGDRGGIAESYNNIGTVHFYLGNYNQSMDYYRRALELRRSIDDKYGIGKNLNNIGLIYYQLGELEKARKYLDESLELKRAMSERAGVANTLSNLGEIHRTLGNYQKSFECESESLALKRQIGDQQAISISASNLGIVCTRLGRYDAALEYLSLALSTTRRIGFRVLEIEVLCNLAETHFEIGNPRQALLLAEQALRLANENSSRPDQMAASLMLGMLYLELDKPDDAVGHLHLAVQLAGDLSNKEKLAAAQIVLGSYYRRVGRLEEALATLDKGLRLARELKSRFWMARASLEQARAFHERLRLEDAAEAVRMARSAATKLQCPELEWQLGFASGQVEAASRRYAAAFEQFRRCVEVFRAAAGSLAAAPMREAYLADRRRTRVAECIRELKAELRRIVRE
jgi:tetratricopeptide (TPR) repeat protein